MWNKIKNVITQAIWKVQLKEPTIDKIECPELTSTINEISENLVEIKEELPQKKSFENATGPTPVVKKLKK